MGSEGVVLGHFLTLLLSSLGTGYLVYGKRQGKPSAILAGVILCVTPLLVSSLVWTILLSSIVAIAPLFLES